MLRPWPLASALLIAAGVAEVGVGVTNRMNLVSFLLGALAIVVGALAFRAPRWAWPAWTAAGIGSVLAFRALAYQAPFPARVLVVVSSALFLLALGLALRARAAEGKSVVV